jgi:hypothetical protein
LSKVLQRMNTPAANSSEYRSNKNHVDDEDSLIFRVGLWGKVGSADLPASAPKGAEAGVGARMTDAKRSSCARTP